VPSTLCVERLDLHLEPINEIVPSHCAYPGCSEHLRTAPGYRAIGAGAYSAFGQRICRYRCPACRRTFSANAFSTTYYLKRPELTLPIAAGLVAGSAHRQIARSLGCAHSTVSRRAARLGRHAILLQAHALEQLRGRPLEPVVLDHFETFELCQQDAVGIATAVGAESGFVYALDPVPHRRGGRKKARARRDRNRPARDPRGGHGGSFARVVDILLDLQPRDAELDLTHDGHPSYRAAIERHPRRHRLRSRAYPNPRRRTNDDGTRTEEARLRDRAMFPVDALHGLLRHSAAHHRRETIAFGRRLNALMERMFLFAVWRNQVKRRRERRPCRESPAVRLGLTEARQTWKQLLTERIFPARERVPALWRDLYRRDWITPALPVNARHRLVHAY